ncbi:hypothetical protein BV20DRAFT_970384 [Pilatotrama ljubarskyi]|nr:hypothetical protein BV20DRAFT_970384 [Pilatotrama ljubarskyi]
MSMTLRRVLVHHSLSLQPRWRLYGQKYLASSHSAASTGWFSDGNWRGYTHSSSGSMSKHHLLVLQNPV